MTNPVTVATMQTTKREIRRRVRRQLMLRRLRNELATSGQDVGTVLRRPQPHSFFTSHSIAHRFSKSHEILLSHRYRAAATPGFGQLQLQRWVLLFSRRRGEASNLARIPARQLQSPAAARATPRVRARRFYSAHASDASTGAERADASD